MIGQQINRVNHGVERIYLAASAAAIGRGLATADWSQPMRSVRPLAFPFSALGIAFSLLYYVEHFR